MIGDFTVAAAANLSAADTGAAPASSPHAAEIKAVAFVAPASNDAEAGEAAILGPPSKG